MAKRPMNGAIRKEPEVKRGPGKLKLPKQPTPSKEDRRKSERVKQGDLFQ